MAKYNSKTSEVNAIEIHNISKSFKVRKEIIQAVDDISFDVKKGELFGLIGPDGAGKTTLLRILTTLLLPGKGSAKVDGLDVVIDYKRIRERVGYMPGRFSLYPELTVEETLQFFATLFKTTVAENYALVKDIYSQLEPFKNRRAGQLSGGMKQKLALSCVLIHKPVVLFLDEPTTGVDAVSRKEFWEMLKKLKQQDITILVSTPYMDEASLCDRVALVQNGKTLSIGTPQEIREAFTQVILASKTANMISLLHDLSSFLEVDHAYTFGEFHHAIMKKGFSEDHLVEYLKMKGHISISIKQVPPTIEDCFMQLMQVKNE
jgi:ABC-2 type transport system ATP-binding protein